MLRGVWSSEPKRALYTARTSLPAHLPAHMATHSAHIYLHSVNIITLCTTNTQSQRNEEGNGTVVFELPILWAFYLIDQS
jgi:hypothetical protein